MIKKNIKQILILLILSYAIFMLGNNIISLTNPDEVFYAQTAKEMVQHKNWMTPYLFGAPQFEKPILLYWFLRLAFMLFGNSSFAARLFPAAFAGLGVVAVYLLGLLGFKNERKAFICGLVLMSCGVYIGLAKTVFTDMIFSVFILFSLLSFYWGYLEKNRKGPGILLFFIFSSLAVLTKGPLGFLIPFAIILLFLLIKREIKFLLREYSLWGLFIFIAISGPWYLFMERKYGPSFNHEFFYNDHYLRLIKAEHAGNDRWYFYPFSMIGCMFPWSVYTLVSLIYLFKNLIPSAGIPGLQTGNECVQKDIPASGREHRTLAWGAPQRSADPIYIFLFSWICVIFIVFQFAHSKLVSYILPLFPALALVTGDFIYNTALFENMNRKFLIGSLITLFILLLIPAGLIVSMPGYSIYLSSKIPAYALVFLLLILPALFSIFLIRRKFFKATFLLAFVVPAILLFVPFAHRDIEPYVSSRTACEYLLKNYTVTGPIICSKFNVRGVRYYTDRDVVATAIPGTNFFSPHPITFLGSDDKLRDYLRGQAIAYCILKKSSVKDMERVAGKEFKITLLKIIGNEYILRVEPNYIDRGYRR